jgi:hypothetical protein
LNSQRHVVSRIVYGVMTVVCMLLLGETAVAQTITFRTGESDYTGTVDTYIQSISPDATAGTIPEVQVDQNPPGFPPETVEPSQGLLRFLDIFGTGTGQIPLGSTITSASLQLFTSNASAGSFTAHRMLVDWDANATWNIFGGDGITLGTDAVSTPTVTFTPSPTGSLILDVTSDVQAWAGGASNFGWAFLTTSTDGWDFTSEEGSTASQRPLLSITYTAIPEPVTAQAAAIAALGAVLLAGRRRRKNRREG